MDQISALRAFVDSVEQGSFSKAALAQGIKVSTVSRYVSALEADLGAALLNRSTHGLHPTEIGRAFHARAVRILADLDEARADARAFNIHPGGVLRLIAPRDFAQSIIAPMLPDFLQRFPDISVQLDPADGPFDLIANGADLGIRLGVLADSSLIARRLASFRRVPVARPDWLAARPGLLHPDEMATVPCVTAGRLEESWPCSPRRGGEAHPVRVSGGFCCADDRARLAAALGGLGIALLPEWLAREPLAAGTLERLFPDWTWDDPRAAIWAVYPPKKTVAPKVRAFIDFIATRLAADQD